MERNISEALVRRVQEQIGGLTFELCKRDAQIELLEEENRVLKDALKQLTPEEPKEQ